MPSLEERLKQAQALKLRQQLGVTTPEASMRGANIPAPVKPDLLTGPDPSKTVDDVVRSVASGATFGLADEAAAFFGGGPEGYSERLMKERARDESISPYASIPSEIVGGLATGTGLSRVGLSFLKGAKPTAKSLATRGAAEGAAYGGAYGFGHGEGTRGRAEEALYGAVLGAGTGAGLGAISAKMAAPKAPTIEAVKQQASKAYEAADKAGVIVRKEAFGSMVDDLQQQLAEAGIDKTIHTKAMAAFNRLREATNENQTLKGLDILRRVIKAAAGSNEADERRIARIMIDRIDDFVTSLRPEDVLTGNVAAAKSALGQARSLWGSARKGEIVQGLIERAGNRAGQFTGSGYENALRTEFRALVQNPKRMRQFSKPEQQFFRRVARGTPIGNALRWLGKLAPRSVVTGGFHLGVSALASPAVGAATMATGEAARHGATAITSRNARQALERVLFPAYPDKPVTLSPQQLAVLRSLLIGSTELEQRGLSAVRPTGRAQ